MGGMGVVPPPVASRGKCSVKVGSDHQVTYIHCVLCVCVRVRMRVRVHMCVCVCVCVHAYISIRLLLLFSSCISIDMDIVCRTYLISRYFADSLKTKPVPLHVLLQYVLRCIAHTCRDPCIKSCGRPHACIELHGVSPPESYIISLYNYVLKMVSLSPQRERERDQ